VVVVVVSGFGDGYSSSSSSSNHFSCNRGTAFCDTTTVYFKPSELILKTVP
jgi:hypothetical protein